ncbi:MAG TPA: IS1595 family transposase [Candidatus Saccharimonadales bacterium]|nr:IS1595 family transposase [Candidatus Saccharimonadales bacterium]
MSDNISLIDFYKKFPNEQACRDFLQKARWNDNVTCPKCGVVGGKIYKLKDTRLLKCATCRLPFSVKVGTVFEDSAIPLQSWFLAVYLCTSLKKGISSVQLAKYLGVTQKSAWHMLHRIRHNVNSSVDSKPLDGIVEIDETYIGGKNPGVRGAKFDKAIVFGAVERGGRAKLTHVPTAGVRVLLPAIAKSISPKATIYSDQLGAYRTLSRRGYTHESINHSELEFARGRVHTNTIEGGVWDHLKLGLKAIYMGVSPKHLGKYCDEFAYRYSTRQLTDGQRFEKWFNHANNKQLTYKNLVS